MDSSSAAGGPSLSTCPTHIHRGPTVCKAPSDPGEANTDRTVPVLEELVTQLVKETCAQMTEPSTLFPRVAAPYSSILRKPPTHPSLCPSAGAVSSIILQIKSRSPSRRSLASISHFKMSLQLYPPPLPSGRRHLSRVASSGHSSMYCPLSSVCSVSLIPGLA